MAKNKLPRTTKKALHRQAYKTVLAVRGSNDVPCFDMCVDAEYDRLVSIYKEESAWAYISPDEVLA